MEKIYIFGHKNPDTDSVTAAITLSNLKNKLGMNTIPAMLGDINNETKFLLNYFNIAKPTYLHDVKLQIKDLNYQKNYYFNELESIYKGFIYMNNNFISTLPIVDNNKKFTGLISMKDIAKEHMSDNFSKLYTSYENILDVLKGQTVLQFTEEIKGNILVPSYRSTTFINTVKIDETSILVIGDRHSIHEFAINSKAQLIILTKDANIKDEHLKMAELNKVSIIKTSFSTFKVARIIHLCNYISSISTNNNIIYFNELDYVEDFIKVANKTKFSNYPVLNEKLECLGILALSDLDTPRRKKVILVDHNEGEQSVIGLEEAEILEIVDHHKIGTIGTSLPISFRNMPVGSTNTIIYQLYQENNVEITKDMAGLMMAGIISDTLLLTSPTTTEIDKDALNKLAKIANINYQNFGMEMFKEGSSLKGKSKEEIVYGDFKNFTIKDKLVGVGQLLTTNPNEINDNIHEYIEFINNEAIIKKYDVLAFFITDILNQGSYMIVNSDAKEIITNAFKLKDINNWEFLPNCISRKKQIVPKLIEEIEKMD